MSRPGARLRVPWLRASGYPSVVLERLVVHARAMLGGSEACLLARQPDEGDDAMVVAAGAGVEPDLIGRRLPADREPLAMALATGSPTLVPNDGQVGWPPAPGVAGQGCVAVAPVWSGGRARAALSITLPREAAGLGLARLRLLGELAELVGRALVHHELHSSDPQPEIEALLRAVKRLPGPGAHRQDLAEIAGVLADELGLAPVDRLELALAARLRDVGKLRLPPRVLYKRTALTEAEWQLVRQHPQWGAEMVAAIPGLEPVALLVRSHHERYDGGGYPDGLSGDSIPLASRIVALCDAFSAMTSNRPYRHRLERAAALRDLADGAGGQFDPQLAECFARAARRVEVGIPA